MKTLSARDLAVGLSLGVISTRDAVEWADSCIMRLDDPPSWLIDISSSQQTTLHDLLKLLPIDSADLESTDQQFLGVMAVRFELHDSLADILPLLYDRFCLCEWTEMTEIRQQIYLIDDEWDWDQLRAIKTARKFLLPFVAEGKILIDKICLNRK